MAKSRKSLVLLLDSHIPKLSAPEPQEADSSQMNIRGIFAGRPCVVLIALGGFSSSDLKFLVRAGADVCWSRKIMKRKRGLLAMQVPGKRERWVGGGGGGVGFLQRQVRVRHTLRIGFVFCNRSDLRAHLQI